MPMFDPAIFDGISPPSFMFDTVTPPPPTRIAGPANTQVHGTQSSGAVHGTQGSGSIHDTQSSARAS